MRTRSRRRRTRDPGPTTTPDRPGPSRRAPRSPRQSRVGVHDGGLRPRSVGCGSASGPGIVTIGLVKRFTSDGRGGDPAGTPGARDYNPTRFRHERGPAHADVGNERTVVATEAAWSAG